MLHRHLRHESHKLDGIQLQNGGAEAAGLQKTTQFGGVGLQDAIERGMYDQSGNLFLCQSDRCCGRLNAGERRLQARLRGSDAGTSGLRSRCGAGHAGFRGKAPL